MVERGSISSVVPYMFTSVARSEGFDTEDLLRGTGVDETAKADEHIGISTYFEIWRRTMEAVGDAAFPLRAAAAFQLEDSEVFGFLAISCETLGQAYERTAAYRGLYNIGARWDLHLEPDASRMVWIPWPGETEDPGYRAAMDYQVADMSNSICRLGKTRPLPRVVRMKHRAPERIAPFSKFYGVEVQFGAENYELIYEAGLPLLPIETHNSKLRDYFDEACRQLVGKFDAAAGVAAQVRAKLIASMDGGDSSLEAIAKQLGMSARSLQRKLTEESTSFVDVLSEVREEFAKRYLARGNISASEVAFLLGFTEPPAFFKAFKRWTGMTPRAYQQRGVQLQ